MHSSFHAFWLDTYRNYASSYWESMHRVVDISGNGQEKKQCIICLKPLLGFFFFFFFFLVLTNPQDIVQLNNIFEKIMKEKTYLENYSILTKVREKFDRHEEFI